ncbi:hypothetical protein [Dendronalium sp. ChiSLP03b]|uniref:hypothetical protein n=1 Tax=Dendronalium sp. ChiSLP03b TaxID=3075381 RepID=UPI0039195784
MTCNLLYGDCGLSLAAGFLGLGRAIVAVIRLPHIYVDAWKFPLARSQGCFLDIHISGFKN